LYSILEAPNPMSLHLTGFYYASGPLTSVAH
jgi:hypothetical protein